MRPGPKQSGEAAIVAWAVLEEMAGRRELAKREIKSTRSGDPWAGVQGRGQRLQVHRTGWIKVPSMREHRNNFLIVVKHT